MLPLRIHRPRSRAPLITIFLICLNVIIFLGTYYSPNFEEIIEVFAFKIGLRAVWSWFTSMFLHADWFHLSGNMVFLYVFGSLIESVIERYKYIILYLVGGLLSSLIQSLVIIFFLSEKASELTAIGASGAITALLGVAMIRFRKNQITWYIITPLFLLEVIMYSAVYMGPMGLISGIVICAVFIGYGSTQEIPLWQLLTAWPVFTITALATGMSYLFMQIMYGLMQVLSGQIGGVAYWAHIGGIIAGIAMVRYLGIESDADIEYLAQDAASLVRQARFKEAAIMYQDLIEKSNKNPYFIHKAARCWALDDNAKESVELFIKAFYGYYNKGLKEDASQVYDDIQNFIPDQKFDAKTEIRFASLCQAQYKLDAAIQGFNKVINDYPGSKDAQLALFRKAQVYEKMGDQIKAKEVFEDFVKSYPNSEWRNLADQWINKLSA